MDWHDLTDYHRCASCGEELEGFVQETVPGKPRVFVTCDSPECHKEVRGMTLRPHEHYALCFTVLEKER